MIYLGVETFYVHVIWHANQLASTVDSLCTVDTVIEEKSSDLINTIPLTQHFP